MVTVLEKRIRDLILIYKKLIYNLMSILDVYLFDTLGSMIHTSKYETKVGQGHFKDKKSSISKNLILPSFRIFRYCPTWVNGISHVFVVENLR